MNLLTRYQKFRIFFLTIATPFLFAPGLLHAQSNALSGSYLSTDTVLVKFIPGTAAAIRSQSHAQAAGRVERVIPGIDVSVVKVPDGSVDSAIQVYQRNPNVIYAEHNYKRLAFKPTTNEGMETPTAGISFNNFNEQWNLENSGQEFGLTVIPGLFSNTLVYPSYQAYADADVNAPEAWAIPLGINNATIAVLDTGVDCDHPDLTSKCLMPHSVVTEHEETLVDFFGHGTHVAGIAAASTDNGMGIAGVAPNALIAPIKTCYQDSVSVPGYIVGTCEDADAAEAIMYAVAQGYQVINMSFAGPNPNSALQEAIDEAWAAGAILVAAAGNNYTSQMQYPAAYQNVIGVGATDYVDNLSGFSTFSQPPEDWVSVLAPGTAIVSTVPGSFCNNQPGSDCIDTKSGSSMASPHVAGLAALMFNHLDQPNNVIIRQAIESSAVASGTLGQNMQAWSAHGRIDMHAALTALDGTNPPDELPTVNVSNPAEGATVSGASVLISATASDDNGITQVEFFVNNASIGVDTSSPYSVNWDSTTVANGAQVIRATATDSIGQTASFSNNVTVNNETGATTIHTGDLDGSSVGSGRGGKWDATVTITVHDAADDAVDGSTVEGAWSSGATGSGSCVTDNSGTCSIAINEIKRSSSSVTFSVTSITRAGSIYDDSVNHDPDPDSNGTVIVISSP